MLVRNRLSRISMGGKIFDSPLKPDLDRAAKSGLAKCSSFATSDARSTMPCTWRNARMRGTGLPLGAAFAEATKSLAQATA